MITENIERSVSEPPGSVLTSAELQRYARHLSMKEVGLPGQRHTQVVTHRTRLTVENCRQIISQYDLVVDGSDNLTTRYLINDACFLVNDACFLLHKPNVRRSVFQFHGQASVFCTPASPCSPG